MPEGLDLSDFTAGEKLRMAGLIARMAKRGMADNGTGNVDLSDLKRRFERIEKQARKRKQQGK